MCPTKQTMAMMTSLPTILTLKSNYLKKMGIFLIKMYSRLHIIPQEGIESQN